jgi:hypothetical protein
MVVTVKPFRGSDVPPISVGDVRVLRNHTGLPVMEWISLQGDMAGLELYVLLDQKVTPRARPCESKKFVGLLPLGRPPRESASPT